jgi:hypothetical protein
MKKNTIFLILILFSLFIYSCKYDFILPEVVPPINPGGDPISFSTQIVPIFAEKCISCHSTQSPRMNATDAYSQLVPNYVNTGTPETSMIYTVSKSGQHYAKVSATQSALILAWITEGAKNN